MALLLSSMTTSFRGSPTFSGPEFGDISAVRVIVRDVGKSSSFLADCACSISVQHGFFLFQLIVSNWSHTKLTWNSLLLGKLADSF